jgi:hypothetical protein
MRANRLSVSKIRDLSARLNQQIWNINDIKDAHWVQSAKCKVFNTRSNCEISLNGFLDLYKLSLTIDSWTNLNEFENSICLSGAHSKRLFGYYFFDMLKFAIMTYMWCSQISHKTKTWGTKKIINSTTCKHLWVNPLQLWAWFKHNFLKQLITGAIRLFDWFNCLDWLSHDNSLSIRPWTCIWFLSLQLWRWFKRYVIKEFRSCEVWNANRLRENCNRIRLIPGLEFSQKNATSNTAAKPTLLLAGQSGDDADILFSPFLLKCLRTSSNRIKKRTFPRRNELATPHNQGKQTREHLRAFSCPRRSNLSIPFNQGGFSATSWSFGHFQCEKYEMFHWLTSITSSVSARFQSNFAASKDLRSIFMSYESAPGKRVSGMARSTSPRPFIDINFAQNAMRPRKGSLTVEPKRSAKWYGKRIESWSEAEQKKREADDEEEEEKEK